jgi:thioredoxin-like negative regulator of GroEL
MAGTRISADPHALTRAKDGLISAINAAAQADAELAFAKAKAKVAHEMRDEAQKHLLDLLTKTEMA